MTQAEEDGIRLYQLTHAPPQISDTSKEDATLSGAPLSATSKLGQKESHSLSATADGSTKGSDSPVTQSPDVSHSRHGPASLQPRKSPLHKAVPKVDMISPTRVHPGQSRIYLPGTTTQEILPEESSVITIRSATSVIADHSALTDANNAETSSARCCQCLCDHRKSILGGKQRMLAVGIVLVTVGAVCWVGVSQAARLTVLPPNVESPFFVVYFSTSCLVLIYPVSLLFRSICKRGNLKLRETIRSESSAWGEEDWWPCPYRPIAKCAALTLIWDLAAYIYVRALGFKIAPDVVALFGTNTSFVYLMAWIVLQKRFIAVRIVAFLVGMTGTILLIYMEASFAGSGMWGSILVILATATAAVHKVLHFRIYGELTAGQMCLVMTSLGAFNALSMWPLLLLLYFTGAEPIAWTNAPWMLLTTTGLFMMGVTLVLSLGASVTHDMVLQTVFIAAIPLGLVSEFVLNPDSFRLSAVQIGAYLLIVLSFLLNCLPNNWHQSLLKLLHVKVTVESADDSHLTPRQRLRHSTIFQGTNRG